MKYQLVIQFREELFEEIDEIANLEDRLQKSLIDAEVDGHDIGSGECNFFREILCLVKIKSVGNRVINYNFLAIRANFFTSIQPKQLHYFSYQCGLLGDGCVLIQIDNSKGAFESFF